MIKTIKNPLYFFSNILALNMSVAYFHMDNRVNDEKNFKINENDDIIDMVYDEETNTYVADYQYQSYVQTTKKEKLDNLWKKNSKSIIKKNYLRSFRSIPNSKLPTLLRIKNLASSRRKKFKRKYLKHSKILMGRFNRSRRFASPAISYLTSLQSKRSNPFSSLVIEKNNENYFFKRKTLFLSRWVDLFLKQLRNKSTHLNSVTYFHDFINHQKSFTSFKSRFFKYFAGRRSQTLKNKSILSCLHIFDCFNYKLFKFNRGRFNKYKQKLKIYLITSQYIGITPFKLLNLIMGGNINFKKSMNHFSERILLNKTKKIRTNINVGAMKHLFYRRIKLFDSSSNLYTHYKIPTNERRSFLLAVRYFYNLFYKRLIKSFYKLSTCNLFDKKTYYLTLKNNKFFDLASPYSVFSKLFSYEPLFNKIYIFKNYSLLNILENHLLFSNIYMLWQYYYTNINYGFSTRKNFLVENPLTIALGKNWTNDTYILLIVYFLRSLIRKKLNIKSLEVTDRRHVVYVKSKRTNMYLGHSYKNHINYGKSAGQYTHSKKDKKIKHFNYLLGVDFFKHYELWQKSGVKPASTFFDIKLNSSSKFLKAIFSAFLKNYRHISVNLFYFHNGMSYGLRKIRGGLAKYKRLSELPYYLAPRKKVKRAKSILKVARNFGDNLQLWEKQKNVRYFMSLFRPLMSLRDYTSYAHGGCKSSQKKIIY